MVVANAASHAEETLLHAFAALLAHRGSEWGLAQVVVVVIFCVRATSAKGYVRFRDGPRGTAVGALLPLALMNSVSEEYQGVLMATSIATMGLSTRMGPLIATLVCAAIHVSVIVPVVAVVLVWAAPRSFSAAEAALIAAMFESVRVVEVHKPAPAFAAAVAAALAGAVAIATARGVRKFYACFLLVVCAIVPAYAYAWMVALGGEPLRWTFVHVVGDDVRWKLVLYWTCALLCCASAPAKLAQRLGRVEARKLYHLLITFSLAPALKFDGPFLGFACAGALAVLLVGETVRRARLLGANVLDALAEPLLDERDGGSLVVTHLYLLIGCAAPVWLAPMSNVRGAAGLATVGVLDAVAAVVGRRIGTTLWPNGAGRTVQGTAAGIVAAIPFCAVFAADLSELAAAVVALIAVGLLEAHSTQIDNLVLPLYFVAVFDAVRPMMQ